MGDPHKYMIEENLTDPELSIEVEPELKQALIDLYLIALSTRWFI